MWEEVPPWYPGVDVLRWGFGVWKPWGWGQQVAQHSVGATYEVHFWEYWQSSGLLEAHTRLHQFPLWPPAHPGSLQVSRARETRLSTLTLCTLSIFLIILVALLFCLLYIYLILLCTSSSLASPLPLCCHFSVSSLLFPCSWFQRYIDFILPFSLKRLLEILATLMWGVLLFWGLVCVRVMYMCVSVSDWLLVI